MAPEQRAEAGSWRKPENSACSTRAVYGQIEVSSQLRVVKIMAGVKRIIWLLPLLLACMGQAPSPFSQGYSADQGGGENLRPQQPSSQFEIPVQPPNNEPEPATPPRSVSGTTLEEG